MRATVKSQDRVFKLKESLDGISNQLSDVNEWIGHYDRQLSSMQKYVSEINSENASLKTETSNRLHLATTALEIIVRKTKQTNIIPSKQLIFYFFKQSKQILDISPSMESAFNMKLEEMNTTEGLKKAIMASEHLLKGLTHEFPGSIKDIRAIRDQRQKFRQLKVTFGKNTILFFKHQFALRPKRVKKNQNFSSSKY